MLLFRQPLRRLALVLCLVFAAVIPASARLILGRHGDSRYSILIDPSAPESVRTSAGELKTYFERVAGVALPIVSSGSVPTTPFISLGNTAAARAAKIDLGELRFDGFRILTREANVFIIGRDTADGAVNATGGIDRGTANGVYTFIEDYLGVRWVMPGELGDEFERRNVIEVPELARTESPVFGYRNESLLGTAARTEWPRRMKLGGPVPVSSDHAWTSTVPASLFDEHPDWFPMVDGKRQRPDTGKGPPGRYKIETTNPELVQYYAGVVIERFRAQPNLRWHSLSPSDGKWDWSESPEAIALHEKDPDGNLSRTRLMLTFYNDVARIVAREYPDHKLGGYIYATYLYPPSGGIPKIERNVTLSVAPNFNYGFQLYRASTREKFDRVMGEWAAIAKQNQIDLYYYDLPTWIWQWTNITVPPAPELLNLAFRTAVKHGFKGAEVYGHPGFAGYSAGNYAIAKLMWNPHLDAHVLVRDYHRAAYGAAAAAHIEKLYAVLEEAFREFYNRHTHVNYTLTRRHLAEIYAPTYLELEANYVKAHAAPKSERQQKRLELLGEVLARTQGGLRFEKLLSDDVKTGLPPIMPTSRISAKTLDDFP